MVERLFISFWGVKAYFSGYATLVQGRVSLGIQSRPQNGNET